MKLLLAVVALLCASAAFVWFRDAGLAGTSEAGPGVAVSRIPDEAGEPGGEREIAAGAPREELEAQDSGTVSTDSDEPPPPEVRELTARGNPLRDLTGAARDEYVRKQRPVFLRVTRNSLLRELERLEAADTARERIAAAKRVCTESIILILESQGRGEQWTPGENFRFGTLPDGTHTFVANNWTYNFSPEEFPEYFYLYDPETDIGETGLLPQHIHALLQHHAAVALDTVPPEPDDN